MTLLAFEELIGSLRYGLLDSLPHLGELKDSKDEWERIEQRRIDEEMLNAIKAQSAEDGVAPLKKRLISI